MRSNNNLMKNTSIFMFSLKKRFGSTSSPLLLLVKWKNIMNRTRSVLEHLLFSEKHVIKRKMKPNLFRHVSAWNLDYPVQRVSATFTKTTLLSEALPDINTAKLINFKLHIWRGHVWILFVVVDFLWSEYLRINLLGIKCFNKKHKNIYSICNT